MFVLQNGTVINNVDWPTKPEQIKYLHTYYNDSPANIKKVINFFGLYSKSGNRTPLSEGYNLSNLDISGLNNINAVVYNRSNPSFNTYSVGMDTIIVEPGALILDDILYETTESIYFDLINGNGSKYDFSNDDPSKYCGFYDSFTHKLYSSGIPMSFNPRSGPLFIVAKLKREVLDYGLDVSGTIEQDKGLYTITDDSKDWRNNQWRDYKLYFIDSANHVNNTVIQSNSNNQLFFPYDNISNSTIEKYQIIRTDNIEIGTTDQVGYDTMISDGYNVIILKMSIIRYEKNNTWTFTNPVNTLTSEFGDYYYDGVYHKAYTVNKVPYFKTFHIDGGSVT